MIKLKESESALFEIVKAILWDRPLDYGCINIYSDTLKLAAKQGLLAFCGTILDKADTEQVQKLSVPQETKLIWLGNITTLEQRYAQQLMMCAALAKHFKSNNIKMMVLKGIGLSKLYPQPSRRECGDIDFYLFGEFEKGNALIKKLIEQNYAEFVYENAKHYVFNSQGVNFEHHKFFLNEARYKVDKILAKYLTEIMNKTEAETLLIKDNTEIFTPPPTFNAIYLARHMIAHLVREFRVRYLTDWCLFLKHYDGRYDKATLLKAFDEAGLSTLLNAITNICVKHLGLAPELNPFGKIDTDNKDLIKIEEKVMIEMLRADYQPKSNNKLIALWQRISRYYASRWKFKLAHGINFAGMLWGSFKVRRKV